MFGKLILKLKCSRTMIKMCKFCYVVKEYKIFSFLVKNTHQFINSSFHKQTNSIHHPLLQRCRITL